jgi:ABC-type dipeptide/oligopeptide/nickel transport system permease component
VKSYRGMAFASGLLIGLGVGGISMWWEAGWYSRLFNGIRLAFDNLPYGWFIVCGFIFVIIGIILGIYCRWKLSSVRKRMEGKN